MKKITFTLLFISIIMIGYGQRKIKKIEVNEKGYNTNITIIPIKNEVNYNGLKIKIVPTSPEKLNKQFFLESNINGKFDYTYYSKSRRSYFLQKRKHKRVKSDFEFLSEGAEWLLDNGEISEKEYNDLNKQIKYYLYRGKREYVIGIDKNISSNPYYIQGKYLSVFKIEFTNPTKSAITFNGLLTVQNGTSIYNPLSIDYITKELYASNLLNVNKSLILERHNLQKSIIVPPNSRVDKFFAVVPINYTKRYLEITLKNSDAKFKYEVNKHETIINKTYTYYEFKTEINNSSSEINSISDFILIESKKSTIFHEGNNIFINANDMNEKFEIFTLSLDASGYLYYGRTLNIKGSDFIDVGRNRRKPIILEVKKIKGLRKKVNQ